jgi:phenylalanyl-tRNA synthetase beta subunit
MTGIPSGRAARLMINNKSCGILGEVHPSVAENFDALRGTMRQ